MVRQAILLCVVVSMMGCDKEGGESIHNAGQRVGESITDFAKGVGSGVDNRLEVPVELAEPVSQLGLTTTVAKSNGLNADGQKSLTVYFLASQPVKEWLMAKAVNADNQEIGRSTVEVELGADDAKYITFEFDREMDSQRVAKYVIVIGKEVAREPSPSGEDATVEKPDLGEELSRERSPDQS